MSTPTIYHDTNWMTFLTFKQLANLIAFAVPFLSCLYDLEAKIQGSWEESGSGWR